MITIQRECVKMHNIYTDKIIMLLLLWEINFYDIDELLQLDNTVIIIQFESHNIILTTSNKYKIPTQYRCKIG